MNLIVLLVLIAEICLSVCAWLSPGFLRRIAVHLLTRADVIEAAREENVRRMTYWQNTLGVNEAAGEPEEDRELAPVLASRTIAAENVRMRTA